MTRRYREERRDFYYKEAKQVGYRARSAFKLKHIQKKYKIIQKGDTVIDLGASPGGWSQVAKQFTGENGTVIVIDLLPIQPIDGISFLRGDITEKKTIDFIKTIVDNHRVNVVLSDVSPDISGNYSIDHARSIYLCEHSLKLGDIFLKPHGNFICKVFTGEKLDELIKKLQRRFKIVKLFSPPSSRKRSSEIYIISCSLYG